ncbi:uncharacterized protein LOC143915687 [Arctopsyche grandis]|uniref:uncharacterized protein LOC143915687 n=1 Tax=Arctopsyche grandis TaxID=121162 RepID=UPI00406D807C
MKSTILLTLLGLAGLSTTASVSNKVNKKRNIYSDGSLYGTHGLLTTDAINAHNVYQIPQQRVPLPTLIKTPYRVNFANQQANFDPFGNGNFGSFLPSFETSSLNFKPLPQSLGAPVAPAFDGYDYQIPNGQRFAEEPVPNSFDLVIPPAMRNLPIPNSNLPPGFRATMVTRRILTPFNEGLFFKYPGYIPEGGLPVTLPIVNTRPTRVVVPQHGAVAFGSGGLGYSYLPGGRIAIGSGSLGLSNIVKARNNLLPPRRPYMKPTEQDFILPQAINQLQRKIDDFSSQQDTSSTSLASSVSLKGSTSANNLTVFPISEEDRRLAEIYNF